MDESEVIRGAGLGACENVADGVARGEGAWRSLPVLPALWLKNSFMDCTSFSVFGVEGSSSMLYSGWRLGLEAMWHRVSMLGESASIRGMKSDCPFRRSHSSSASSVCAPSGVGLWVAFEVLLNCGLEEARERGCSAPPRGGSAGEPQLGGSAWLRCRGEFSGDRPADDDEDDDEVAVGESGKERSGEDRDGEGEL